jgi:hypothetical protein
VKKQLSHGFEKEAIKKLGFITISYGKMKNTLRATV